MRLRFEGSDFLIRYPIFVRFLLLFYFIRDLIESISSLGLFIMWPIQKPHIPIYLGGYVTKTFNRIANYADGWLASVSGPLEYVDNSIKILRDQGSKANRNPNEIKVLALVFPQIAARTNNN